MSSDAIDRILAFDEGIEPSFGFQAATMERVRAAAAMPEPIPFPWRRAVPGLVLAAGVFGWGAGEAVRYALPEARQILLNPPAISPASARGLEAAGWVALALAVSFCSWILSVRLVRRSSLL
jgi:hypothetical protein